MVDLSITTMLLNFKVTYFFFNIERCYSLVLDVWSASLDNHSWWYFGCLILGISLQIWYQIVLRLYLTYCVVVSYSRGFITSWIFIAFLHIHDSFFSLPPALLDIWMPLNQIRRSVPLTSILIKVTKWAHWLIVPTKAISYSYSSRSALRRRNTASRHDMIAVSCSSRVWSW